MLDKEAYKALDERVSCSWGEVKNYLGKRAQHIKWPVERLAILDSKFGK